MDHANPCRAFLLATVIACLGCDQPSAHTPNENTTAAPTGTPRARAELHEHSQETNMVKIPAGEFLMGSPVDEVGRDEFSNDESQHLVSITAPFFISKYEVTNGEFKEFVSSTGYVTNAERRAPGESSWRKIASGLTDQHAVCYVSWEDAQAYCEWLSKQKGKTYRLPTESEWEYACRSGTTTRFHCGDELSRDDANYSGSASLIQPVGQYAANAFGLYDMHGNVAEWCQDLYHDDDESASDDVDTYVLRGGAWSVGPDYCRSAHREGMSRGNMMTGFRVAHD